MNPGNFASSKKGRGDVGGLQMPHFVEEYKDESTMSDHDYSKQLFPHPVSPDSTLSPTIIRAKKRERDTLMCQSTPQKDGLNDLRMGESGLYKRGDRHENRQEQATRTILMDAIVVDVSEEEDPPEPYVQRSDLQGMTDVDLTEEGDGYNGHRHSGMEDYFFMRGMSFQRFRNVRFVRLLIWIAVSVLIISVTMAQIVKKARRERSSSDQTTVGADTPSLFTVDTLVKLVVDNGWSQQTDFDIVESPQSLAVQWLVTQDTVARTLITDYQSLLQERYATTVLYFALGGADWHLQGANFMQPNKSVCQWYDKVQDSVQDRSVPIGLDCGCQNLDSLDMSYCDEPDTTVKRIILPSMNLLGSIPNEIYLFESLVELDFNRNKINGVLPTGSQEHLRYVSMSNNALSGSLITWTEGITNLRFLDVSNNTFVDVLSPPAMKKMTELQVLNINRNKISADIAVFRNMNQLRALLVSENNISGEIDQPLVQSLRNLEVLDASKNNLIGEMMNGKIGHPTMAVLDLHKNEIGGDFPVVQPTESKLAYLSLRDNRLKGTLPPTILELTDVLYHLDVARNLLGGEMPTMLSKLQALEYLDLSFNSWDEGTVPVEFGELHNLRHLALQETNRIGMLSAEMFKNWTLLELLDMGHNLLAGPLPINLGPSTPQLKTVVLYHNAFKGKLLSLENATQLETVILNGGNEWDDRVQLEPFCDNQKFSRMDRFVVRPCTNNNQESHMLLPYCSCCHCCPDSSTSECHLYHWFPETDNAWDTRYTKDRFRTREVMLSEADLLKLSNANEN